jgi:hypothetical protein
MSYEHLYRLEAQELEKAACAEEKSGKSETCGKATTIVYLTRRERRAANRRAKRLALKRARESGESRLVRLFVEDGVPKLLKEVEERRETLEKAPQPQNPNPEGGTPNG